MTEVLPPAVILDFKKPYLQFIEQSKPFLAGTDTIPRNIVEDIWEAMFDKETCDECMVDLVSNYGRDARFDRGSPPGAFLNIVTDLALAVYDKVEKHHLYGERGYLPFNMQVRQDGVFVLRLDKELDKIQTKYRKDADEEVEVH